MEARPLAPSGPASLQTANGGLARIGALSPLAALRRPEAGIGSRGSPPETSSAGSEDGFAKVLRQAVGRGEPEAEAAAPASRPDRLAEEATAEAVAAGGAAQQLPAEDPPVHGRWLSGSAPPGADPGAAGVQRLSQDAQDESGASPQAHMLGTESLAGLRASPTAPGPFARGLGPQEGASGQDLPETQGPATPPGGLASPQEMRPTAQPAILAGAPSPVAGGGTAVPEPAALAGSAAATGTPGPAAGSTPAAAGAAAEMRLATPPGQPGFAATLGSTVTLMLRDGLQAARLHLHPVELGPISVRIALEGTAARVHLSAEHPLTRQAMEQALPVLAGSLRESGLTLAGGGVSDQPRQGGAAGGPAADGGGRDRGREGGGDPARDSLIEIRPGSAPAGIAGRRGLVDLVA